MITAETLVDSLARLLVDRRNIDVPQGMDYMTKTVLIDDITCRDLEDKSLNEFHEKWLNKIGSEAKPWTDVEYIKVPKGIDADNIKIYEMRGFDFQAVTNYKNVSVLVVRAFDIQSSKFLTRFRILVKKLPQYIVKGE